MLDEQQERVPPTPGGEGGAHERTAAGAGRGCSGPAEERRRQGQRPMIANTLLSDLF